MKAGRAYQTDYASHEGLIHSFARKGYARLQAAHVSVEYEDVFQDMCFSFAKAQKSYNPETGFSFTAYFGRAIWNDFNKKAQNAISEQVELGLVRVEDMATEDNDGDMLEYLIADIENASAPDELIERRQEFISRFEMVLRSVSPATRKVIIQFMAPSDSLKEMHKARRAHFELSVSMGIRKKPVAETITIEYVIQEILEDAKDRSRARAELREVVEKMESMG